MRGRLHAEVNPVSGSLIAASLHNTWQFIATFFAAADLGAVFVPCNPHWRAAELRWFAKRLRFAAVVTDRSGGAELERLGDLLPAKSILVADDADPRRHGGDSTASAAAHRSDEEPAAYLPTSGSTGAPRIVPRSHRNLAEGSRNVAHAIGIGPGRRFMSAAPFYNGYGFGNAMLMPLMSGATVVLMRQFHPATCADLVRRERVDVFTGSPAIYGLLATAGRTWRSARASSSASPPARACPVGSPSAGVSAPASGCASGTARPRPA